MTRKLLIITQNDIDLKIAESIKSRELELISYDFEHAHHENAIAELGDLKWDETNQKYKGLARDQMIVKALADGLDHAAIHKISELNALEFHKQNLHAVKSEIAKSERSYNNLLKKLPAGEQRDFAFTALKDKENTKTK